MKQSMVAMLGEIMPAPLTQPPSRTRCSPRSKEMAISLAWVSLVMMAAATCAAVFRAEAGDESVVFRFDAHHRHRQADHAGGSTRRLPSRLSPERFGHGVAHRVGIMDALHAGAGIGVAGVGDDGAEVALAEMCLGDADGRGLHAVGGEGAGGTAWQLGINQARDPDDPQRGS